LDFRGKDAEHEIMLSDPKAYRFRPVSLADLPRLRAWLQTPEVVRWWGDPAEQLELIREDLKDPRMVMCIVSFGGRPFAYVQDYAVHNWPQSHFKHLPAGSRAIDDAACAVSMLGEHVLVLPLQQGEPPDLLKIMGEAGFNRENCRGRCRGRAV
jgi:hypothetical protein